MKKRMFIIIFVFLFILIGAFSYKYIYPTYTSSYSLKGDYVPSLRKVLDRNVWVSSYEKSNKNKIYSKKYVYKKQKNVIEDLKVYSNYLIKMEQFEVLSAYDLSNPIDTSIILGKKSHVEEDKIILVDISYTSDTITVSLSKKKGSFLE